MTFNPVFRQLPLDIVLSLSTLGTQNRSYTTSTNFHSNSDPENDQIKGYIYLCESWLLRLIVQWTTGKTQSTPPPIISKITIHLSAYPTARSKMGSSSSIIWYVFVSCTKQLTNDKVSVNTVPFLLQYLTANIRHTAQTS
jgi:hypothetical protein